MSDPDRKVIIVPCSGIGKSYGTVSRWLLIQVVEEDRSNRTQLIPLALLVMKDEASQKIIAESPGPSRIDGCKLALRHQDGPAMRWPGGKGFCSPGCIFAVTGTSNRRELPN